MFADEMMVDSQAVINAFAKTLHPGDRSLCACQCAECRSEVAKFKGKKWSQLKLDDFAGDGTGANIAMLTPAAFCYFLPGLILLTLTDVDCGLLVSRIVDRLIVCDKDTEERRSGVGDVLKRLSARQRAVLIDVADAWRLKMPYAPLIWESLVASLRNGTAACYSADAVDGYNRLVVAGEVGRQI